MPHDLNPEWGHVYEWLELPATEEGEADAKRWLDEFTKPATERDSRWFDARVLTCIYEGEPYRVIGASRLGDIWLTKDMARDCGYEKRVDVLACSTWKMVERVGTE